MKTILSSSIMLVKTFIIPIFYDKKLHFDKINDYKYFFYQHYLLGS